jgi:hypothetical protein
VEAAGSAVEARVAQLLVTSADSANGGGYDAILGFDSEGELIGPFSSDPRTVDPRGLSLDPSGALIYLNSGDDRVLALDRLGDVVGDSGPRAGSALVLTAGSTLHLASVALGRAITRSSCSIVTERCARAAWSLMPS